MAPPSASSSSSHGSPLDQHPPFQAAQRRADEREGCDGEDHDGVAEGRRCFACGVNKQHWFSLLKILCHKTRAMWRGLRKTASRGWMVVWKTRKGLSSSGVRSRSTEFQISSMRRQRSFRIGWSSLQCVSQANMCHEKELFECDASSTSNTMGLRRQGWWLLVLKILI